MGSLFARAGLSIHPAVTNMSIPAAYGLVGGAVATSIVGQVLASGRVMQARKKYGVKYPTLYATVWKNDKDELVSHAEDGTAESGNAFNSAQRGHARWRPDAPDRGSLLAAALGDRRTP